jgi:predicted metal-dependent phosphoesterase TrpH
MKFDLHIHTTRYSPDSRIDPETLVRTAREIGLDGIVITEHDRIWPERELQSLRTIEPDLFVFAGVEVSADQGHFLVYGVGDDFNAAWGIDVVALCKLVHDQGGVVVAAHPFRWDQPFDEILERDKPELDGLELMSRNMDAGCRERALEVQERMGLAGLGSSDAHHESALGDCYSEFPATIRKASDIAAAIRARQVTAHQGPPAKPVGS